jgi:carboxypeptidase family protein
MRRLLRYPSRAKFRPPHFGLLAATTLACVLNLGGIRAFGQAYTASLMGVVTDSSGAVIPNVSIVVRNMATGAARTTTTGPDGRYSLAQLPPATYEVEASAKGFKTYSEKNLTLFATHAAELNVTLQVGESSTTVTVSAPVVAIDTLSPTQSATLTSAMLTELPEDVRTPLALVYTQASATQGILGSPNAGFDQNSSGFTLKGSRSMGSAILLDGASDTAADWGGLLVSPASESLTEMQVIDNTYDAQFGKTEGGVVSMVTKSGTANFHGEAYDFLENDELNATPWGGNTFTTCGSSMTKFQCDSLKKPEFKRNQFGFNFGGPISASRHLFFFGAYEGYRQPFVSDSGVQTVPTLAQRNGDFSATYNPDGSLQVLYDPFTTTPDPVIPGQFDRNPVDASCVGVVFPNTCPGNVVPAAEMNKVGQAVIALFPKPNLAGDPITGANNYRQIASGSTLTDRFDARVDWAHNDKHSMYVRWSMRARQDNNTPDFYGNGAESGAFKSDKNPGYQGVWGNTFTPSPNWIFNVLVESGRWNESQISPALGRLTPASVGLSNAQFQASLLPEFDFEGYQTLGDSEIRNFIRYENTLQLNATHEMGTHSVKFGFTGEDALVNNIDRFSAFFPFNRGMTSGPIAATDSSTTGNSLASLLFGTGAIDNGAAPLNPDIAAGMRYYGFYGQDTWRVSSRLTLIYGLRYEIQPGATERFNRWSPFNLNLTSPLAGPTGLPLKGGFQYANNSDRRLWETDFNNFAPRLGFAYKVTDKLVMRGGFGIFTMPAQALITFDSPGQDEGYSTQTAWVSSVGGGGLVPQDLLSNPFPNGKNQPTGATGGAGTALGQSLGQIWLKGPHPTGYQQNFSLNFQYALTPNRVVEVGYAGFRARKILYGNPSLNMDQLSDQFLSMGAALDAQVPNPFFGLITSGSLSGPTVPANQLLRPYSQYTDIEPSRSLPGARANFDSLGIRFSQQFKSGLTLLSSYQWSKTLDDASEDQGWSIWNGQWRDYYNRKMEYSISSHDVPQSFVTSLVYDLPVGRGKKFGGNMGGVANTVVGGWEVASVLTFHSGLPLLIGAGGNSLQSYGFGRAAYNLVNAKLLNVSKTPMPDGGIQWFNGCTQFLNGSTAGCIGNEPVAWVQPGDRQIGNEPRFVTQLRGDATRNTDLSLSKYFRLTERFKLQFRGDFLNAWNTPSFNGPDNFISDGSFGQMFGTSNSPRNIQVALKLLF